MKEKLNILLLSRWATLLIGLVMLLAAACTASTPAPINKLMSEGFAIYLVAQKPATNEILEVNLSGLELEKKPILSNADIIAYSKDAHKIELTPSAYERIGQLKIPTSGLPFVVCVDRQPIYAGAFWVGYSSQSFNGIVIDALYAQQNLPIRIQLGYPESPELFMGEDLRSDPRIMQALEKAGKLK
jgi:hypothetical protein